jgi:hypothetical protein
LAGPLAADAAMAATAACALLGAKAGGALFELPLGR